MAPVWQGAPGPQAYAYQRTPAVVGAESDAVASLVMGIIGTVLAWLLAGLILGPLANSRGRRARAVLDEQNHNFWIALAGIITGWIGFGLSVFMALYYIVLIIILVVASQSYY